MSENFSKRKRFLLALGLPAWVFASFFIAQLLLVGVIRGLDALGVPLRAINDSVFDTIIGALVYILTFVITIGLPWWIYKRRTTLKELSLIEWPRWRDLLFVLGGFFAYFLFSGLLLAGARWLEIAVPFINLGLDQQQDVGFDSISRQYEYGLAFVTLVVLAPIAEEVLFRGYLFGKLRKYVPVFWAMLITSLLFAAVHGAWNVGLDTFALSMVMCVMVYWSGSIWPAILLHMAKNFIAFYFLFLNPFL